LRTLHAQGCRIFLEIGPKPVLSGLGQQNFPEEEAAWLPSLRYGVDDWRQMLGSLAQLHTHGVMVDWRRFDGDYARRKIAVPTYPFQRQRYWIDGPVAGFQPQTTALSSASRTRAKTLHPLLGKRVYSAALPPGAVQFEVELGCNAPAFLNDHRVFETAILPAAAYIEMVMAAGAQILGTVGQTVGLHGLAGRSLADQTDFIRPGQTDSLPYSGNGSHSFNGPQQGADDSCVIVEDIAFHQALLLPEGEMKTVQIVLTPVEQSGYSFQIFSLMDSEASAEPTWLCHAAGRVMRGSANVNYSPEPEPLPETISVDAHYERARERGNHFCPNFRLLESLARGESTGLGRACLPGTLAVEAGSYRFHPALLDACLQVVSAAFRDSGLEEVYFPVGVERLAVYERPGRELWSRARFHKQGESDKLIADLEISGIDGKIVAHVKGLALKRANREALLGTQPEYINNMLYEAHWQEQERRISTLTERIEPRCWLIVGDDGSAAELAKLLRQRGDQCVECGAAELESLLDRFGNELPPPAGVIYLCGVVHPEVADAAQKHCAEALALLHGLIKLNVAPSLWLVTRAAQAVTANCAVTGLAQAALWGLGKVIAQEHPEIRCVRIDLDARSAPEADARNLLEELEQTGEDQIALRGAARYVARLRRLTVSATEIEKEAPLFRPDASYLIAGGLGRLGLLTARWMAARGARHLVLVSRNGASPAAQEELRALEQLGARPIVMQADIADREELWHVLKIIRAELPALRGVIHSAGVLEDGVLQQQTADRFVRVLAAKASGAWHLHELTLNEPLDFFVLFSSVASLFGSPGQANHAAGNAFLDALAAHRQAQGLPGLSVNWGIWSGAGAATVQVNERLQVKGMEQIAPAHGLAVLEQLLRGRLVRTAAQVGVAPIDWAEFTWADTIFCSELAANVQPAARTRSDLRERLADVSAAEAREMLRELVHAQVAWILGLSASDSIDPQQGFYALGIDSLASLQLKNRLQAALDVPLPATIVFNHPTIESLTRYLAAMILPQAAAEPVNSAASHLDGLSSNELAQLLTAQIARMNGAD